MKKIVILSTFSLIALAGIFSYHFLKFNDGKLHLIFCNVGQGDAIFVRTPSGADILIDGGPNSSVLKCLSDHMPFYDRDIEAIFASHPDSDHITGILDVVERYEVDAFYEPEISGGTKIYDEIERSIKEKGITKKYIFAGDKLKISDGVTIDTLWPTREYVEEKRNLAKNNKNLFSLVQFLTYSEKKVLLTGDIEAAILDDIGSNIGSIDIFKLPHHGSKTGVDNSTFDKIKASLAIISAGKNNSYHHPHPSVLNMLRKYNIEYKRTDIEGEIKIVTDGKTTKVVNN